MIVAAAVGAPVAWWFTRTDVTCGVVIDIEQASITDVRSFSLRSPQGAMTSFAIVPARLAPTSFVPGHLREHRALATPVCVTFRPADSPAVALDLQDAPTPGGSPAPTGTGAAASATAPGTPTAFHSTRYGYGLAVPAGFTATETPGAGGLHPAEPGVDTFDDGHGTRLYVIRFAVPAGMRLTDWVCPVSTHLATEHRLAAELSEGRTIGGQPARLSMYHLRIPPYVTLYLEAEVVKGTGGFAIGLESTTTRDADDRALFEEVLRSVSFE
jgi:hypothetical protein